MKWFNWHTIASIALAAGSWAASTLIPATAAIALGPLSIPVAGVVTGVLAIAAAQGVVPQRTLTTLLQNIKKP